MNKPQLIEYEVLVEDRYVETIASRWPLRRLFSQIRRKYPDAKRVEVRRKDRIV
jgi:hypothetical protein